MLLALLLWSAWPAAHAAKGMEIAISDEDAIVDRQATAPRDGLLAAAQALGATRMRILVQWSRVSDAATRSPSGNPDYNWSPIDDAIDAGREVRHARPARRLPARRPIRRRATARTCAIVKPNPERYARLRARRARRTSRAASTATASGTSRTTRAGSSPSAQSAKIYRKLYQAGYKAIKEADPAAQVLIGETVPYGGGRRDKLGLAIPPLKWLRASPASTRATSARANARR